MKASSQGSVQLLRYTDGGKFFATVKYLTTIPLNGKIGSCLKQHELREEEVEVHEQWVDDNFGKDMKPLLKWQQKVQRVWLLQLRVTIPIKGKFTRVKYVPPHTKMVIDKKEEEKARKEQANQPSFFETFKMMKPVEKKKVEISCEEKFVAYTQKGGEGFEISEKMLIVENCDSNKVFVLSVNRSEKNRNRMKKQIR